MSSRWHCWTFSAVVFFSLGAFTCVQIFPVLKCVPCSVSSAPCPPTETSPTRTCWVSCSGTVPVSSGLVSDTQASVRLFRQEEEWGSQSQRRVWTGGDPSMLRCVPLLSPTLSISWISNRLRQLKGERTRRQSQPAHFLPPALVL